MAPRIRYPVPDLNERSKSRYQIDSSRAPDDIRWGGEAISDFEVRHIRFEDDPRNDAKWHFDCQLGKGHFGLVGLWQKNDEQGVIVDRLAVKELKMPTTNMYSLGDSGRDIPEEAIIQVALQKKDCVPVLQMRGLGIIKTGPMSQSWEHRIRYYMEYCTYGDLASIVDEYTRLYRTDPAFHEHVPEPFLWQLLYNFAQAMVAMESPPFDHPNALNMGPDSFILHLDVKTANIMLGATEDENIIQGYPACKIGDWGISKLTGPSDMRNSANWWNSGTWGWFPPEQMERNGFGRTWWTPPPWRPRDRSDGRHQDNYPYTTAHSTFAFASVVFRLMVLDDRLPEILDSVKDNEHDVWNCNFECVKSSHMDNDLAGRPTGYSALLKETIASCLHLDPASRPPSTDLLQIARTQCNDLARNRYQNGRDTFPQLRTTNAQAQAAARRPNSVQW